MIFKKIIITIFILILSLPLIQSMFHFMPETKLGGEIQIINKPYINLTSWLSGDIQKYFETKLDQSLGLKGYFIKTDNQINYLLFGQIYQKTAAPLIIGKHHYIFEKGYIDSYIGTEKVDLNKLSEQITLMKKVQDKLQKQNKIFLFVISPSKANFFKEYIPNSALKGIHTEDLNYNYFALIRELKKQNINYWDGSEFFLSQKSKSTAPLFSKSGTHWSLYGACLATKEIINLLGSQQNINYISPQCNSLDWSNKPLDQDADLLNLSNIWFKYPFEERLAYPKTEKISNINNLNILLIGDSFSWNFVRRLETGPYVNNYNFAYYFNTLYSFPDRKKTSDIKQSNELLNLIEYNNAVIVEINESGISDIGWGFLKSADKVL